MSRQIRTPRIISRRPGNVVGCTTAAQVMERGHDLAFTVEKALAPIDALVASGALAFDHAQSSDGGSRVWIKASIPSVAAQAVGPAKVGDTVGAHVMISHGHGGAGITITAVIEALVCLNGMRRSIAGGTTRMRHTGNVAERVRTAVLRMEVVQRELARVQTIGTALTTRGPRDVDAVLDYLAAVYQEDAAELAATRKAQTIGNMFLQNTMIGGDLETRRGTWWGLYNALTEYLTHEHGRSDDTRREALVWGTNGDLVNRGLDVAYVMGWTDADAPTVAAMSTGAVAARASEAFASA